MDSMLFFMEIPEKLFTYEFYRILHFYLMMKMLIQRAE